MSIYQYRYRAFGASWGFAMDIDCALLPSEDFTGITVKISPHLYFAMKNHWIDNDIMKEAIDYLILVLQKLDSELMDYIKIPTVIDVTYLEILPTEFQKETLAYAIVGWLKREFDLNFQLPILQFDKQLNKYIIDYSFK